eukprot:TRINITY_DN18708_c0_g1_i1.p1 TRINITY_DN18708_c0_g1~~TRINITY_DN18708_c0_g1_i1.p1  ORF type:complete len:392 (+),score=117.02 TRINITY_DN18708_c0_g1_i1:282-1457(+)
MTTANPFDLLGDDDNGDTSPLDLVKDVPLPQKKMPQAAAKPAITAKQPAERSQPGNDVRNGFPGRGGRGGRTGGRGQDFRGGRTGGRGQEYGFSNRGRGSYSSGDRYSSNGFNNNDGTNGFAEAGEDVGKRQENGDFGRSSERGRGSGRFRGRGGRGFGRRGGYANGAEENDENQRPRRVYDRRSGTGRGTEIKRDGAGRGNWGTAIDQEPVEPVLPDEALAPEEEKNAVADGVETTQGITEETTALEPEKKEEEDKEMTLDEYEKLLEEKRKGLLALKVEERKVDAKEFEAMKLLSVKKNNEEVFIKLGSEKDAVKRKELNEKEEKTKKSMNITEFLKPSDGETYYSSGGRGRGRGRGRGGFRGGFNGAAAQQSAPQIEDPGQFPALGGK